MERVMRVVVVMALLAGGGGSALAEKGDRGEDRPDRLGERMERRRERMEALRKEMEIRRTIRIADKLEVSESEALQINEQLKQADQRRGELRKQLRAEVKALRDLAMGSPTAAEVDEKIKKIGTLRGEILRSEDAALQSVSKGMTPARKARLALIIGLHDRAMGALVGKQLQKRMNDRRGREDDDRDPYDDFMDMGP